MQGLTFKTKVMKATTNKDKKFTPVELTITIESKRELELLCCMFNANEIHQASLANEGLYNDIIAFDQKEFNTHAIWKPLDRHL